MKALRAKAGYFLLEGGNAFATSFFFSYLLFLFRDQFHFGNRENLAVGALHGLVYIFGSWHGGRLAQRRGNHVALAWGFSLMLLGLAAAGMIPHLAAQIPALLVWTVGMSFTWPALEALVSEGEDDRGLPRVIGLYNLVWAGMAGLGYFVGGAIFDHLGKASLYWLPMLFLAAQMALLAALARRHPHPLSVPPPPPAPHPLEAAAFQQPISPATFLKMAWLANPFSYMGINTLLLVIPDLARRFHLSPTQAGIFCSIWFFTRLAAFAVLWRWTGWHYRFRWLLFSFLALLAGFLLLLLARQLWLVVAAQILFGAGAGLIYYSSLFYSMDVGEETRGAHGGLHEAAIGLGICAGPALGAGSLQLLPSQPNAHTWAVAALMALGLVALLWFRFHRKSCFTNSPSDRHNAGRNIGCL